MFEMPTNTAIINIDKELCTGCRRCSEVCPVDAIEGNEGEPQKVNTDKCIVCGQCVQTCKGYAPIYEEIPTRKSKKLYDRGMLSTEGNRFLQHITWDRGKKLVNY